MGREEPENSGPPPYEAFAHLQPSTSSPVQSNDSHVNPSSTNNPNFPPFQQPHYSTFDERQPNVYNTQPQTEVYYYQSSPQAQYANQSSAYPVMQPHYIVPNQPIIIRQERRRERDCGLMCCEVFCAVILPPIGVLMEFGCGFQFCLNLLLTILFYFPVAIGNDEHEDCIVIQQPSQQIA